MWRARQYFTNAGYENTTRRRRRRCSRVRRPRFPQLADRPHPSSPGHECLKSNPAQRVGTGPKNTFGETFAEARADTVESVFPSPTGRLRGQRPQRQKRKNHGPSTASLLPHPSRLGSVICCANPISNNRKKTIVHYIICWLLPASAGALSIGHALSPLSHR
jgi:hypothetical protein